MYPSNSQDYYLYGEQQPPPLQQTPRNHPSYAPQQNHGQFVGHGSTYANGPGHLQMQHSNGGYETTPTVPYYATAESLQRDFDQYMRETGSIAPLPPATHHSGQAIHPYHQQPPATNSRAHPYPTYRDARAPTGGYHGGQEANYPVSGRGTESSSSTRPRPSVSNSYAKVGPAPLPKGSRTARHDEVVEDAPISPYAKLGNVMGPLGPTNYVVVPQHWFYWNNPIVPPIEFLAKGCRELGVGLKEIRSRSVAIENSKDKVLQKLTGIRVLRIKIEWPGYHTPFEGLIKTDDGNITRDELLDKLCAAVVDYVLMLKDTRAKVVKESSKWMIGGKGGLEMETFSITGLFHRGGAYFQPEIWVPRRL